MYNNDFIGNEIMCNYIASIPTHCPFLALFQMNSIWCKEFLCHGLLLAGCISFQEIFELLLAYL